WEVIKDHHDPYITSEQWQRIQPMLERGPRRQPAPGRGASLLQGSVVCGRCGGQRWMRTTYDRRIEGGQSALHGRYSCYPMDKFGRLRHPRISCAAPGLDHVIAEAVLSAVSPVDISVALMAAQQDEAEQEATALARQRGLHRAEQEVVDLKRHYFS